MSLLLSQLTGTPPGPDVFVTPRPAGVIVGGSVPLAHALLFVTPRPSAAGLSGGAVPFVVSPVLVEPRPGAAARQASNAPFVTTDIRIFPITIGVLSGGSSILVSTGPPPVGGPGGGGPPVIRRRAAIREIPRKPLADDETEDDIAIIEAVIAWTLLNG